MKKLIIILTLFILLGVLVINAAESTTNTASTGTTRIEKDIGDTETPIGNIIGNFGAEDFIVKNANIVKEKGLTRITFKDKGFIRIRYSKDDVVTYTDLKKININGKDEDPQLVFNEKATIVGAQFTAGKEGDYYFKNEKIHLPEGARFYLKDGKAEVVLPANTKIESFKSSLVDLKKEGIDFSLRFLDNSPIVFSSGDKFTGELRYKNSMFYFNKDAKINELTIKNTKSVDTYLDFTGKPLDVNGAYISINKAEKTIVIGTNTKDNGPGVMFGKDNPYGLLIQDTDHFAVQAIGSNKKSYIMITDKDRGSKGLIPKAELVGHVAISQDNKAVGTYLQDDRFYVRINGKFIEGFDGGATTVPIEISAFKWNEKNEKVSIDIDKPGWGIVVSNNLELGYGPEAGYIRGSAYSKDYPLMTRAVSNRVVYNYVEYSKKGFEDYTKLLGTPIPLTLDSYAASKMTPDKYRMLIDIVTSLTPTSRKWLQEDGIRIQATASGALAWGWPGGLKIRMDALDPGTLRHEMGHAASLGRGGSFYSEWASVGGGSVAFTSNYGSSNEDEDVAEFCGEFLYKNTQQTLTSSRNAKYYRGKMAVLAKYEIISKEEFYTHFSRAGLLNSGESVDQAIQRFINEARR